jgi:hypothetical protein
VNAGPSGTDTSSSGNSPGTSGSTGAVGVAGKAPVQVGVVTFPDVSQFAAAFGGAGVSTGDQQAEAEAAAAYVNAHGGLAGRQVKLVFHPVSLTSANTYAQGYQEICADFTEDHHVLAGVFIGNAENGLPACMQKGHALLVTHGHYLRSAGEYRGFPLLAAPEEVSADRVARAVVHEIAARNLVAKGGSLGVIIYDIQGAHEALEKVIQPAMAARGAKVVSYSIPYPKSTPDIGNSVSVVQSAELSFASRGVKTVTFLCPACFDFFMQDAESQAYYPTYVLTTLDNLGGQAGKGHGRSLQSAVGISYNTTTDVSTFSHPEQSRGNPTYALCRRIEKKNIVDDASLYASVALCGAILDIAAAANANPVAMLDPAALAKGFAKLGSSHAGAANFSTLLGPDRTDGANSYGVMRYAAGCDCFAYESKALRPLP